MLYKANVNMNSAALLIYLPLARVNSAGDINMYDFLEELTLSDLLLLRVLLDQVEPYSNFESDMLDLYQFPERLHGSYASEWRCYIKRRFYELRYQPEAIEAWLSAPASVTTLPALAVSAAVLERFRRYQAMIQQAQLVAAADNIKPLIASPLQRWLEKMMS